MLSSGFNLTGINLERLRISINKYRHSTCLQYSGTTVAIKVIRRNNYFITATNSQAEPGKQLRHWSHLLQPDSVWYPIASAHFFSNSFTTKLALDHTPLRKTLRTDSSSVAEFQIGQPGQPLVLTLLASQYCRST